MILTLEQGTVVSFHEHPPPSLNRSRVIVLSLCTSRIWWNADNSSTGQEITCLSVVRRIITAVCVNRRFAYIVRHITSERFQRSCGIPGPWVTFHSMFIFCGEELLAPRSPHMLEDYPMSVVRYSLFCVFAAALQIRWLPPTATWGRAMPWWLDLGARIKINCISKKFNGRAWTGFIWLTVGQVVSFCEQGSELSGCIKCDEFFDYLRNCKRLKDFSQCR